MDVLPQTSLIAALQAPDAYAHAVEAVTLVETHISWVFLTGDYAYKVKKPVNLGFLDFSSLEQRLYWCGEEVRLNQFLAPDIYLEVVPITGSLQRPRVQGSGEPLEWAVKMSQFPSGRLFSDLVAERQLSGGLIDQLAGVLALFHSVTPAADSDTLYGSPEMVSGPVEANFRQIERAGGWGALPESIRCWSEAEFGRIKKSLIARKQGGFIRECHGDLHLGNIVCLEDQPVLFDRLEFNPSLRWIDLLSDLAFLVMDLEDHGRVDFAWQLLNRYLELTGDYEGLPILRYYLAYRAMVRAKVAILRAAQTDLDMELRLEFNKYVELANAYTAPGQPRIILMHGLSGSGKSTLSAKLMSALPALRLRSDIERKRLFGIDLQGASKSTVGSGIYTPEASDETYARLLELTAVVCRAGYSAVVDAAFLHRRQRSPFIKLAARCGVPLSIVHCRADPATLRTRVARRTRSGKGVSEADIKVLERQLQRTLPLSESELAYSVTFDTGKSDSIVTLIDALTG